MSDTDETSPPRGRTAERRPRLRRLPQPRWLTRLPSMVAAALVGLVCGMLADGLVWTGQRGCDVLRGRPVCGGGLGFTLLVAVVAVTFLLAIVLLRICGSSDPPLTAFFGIGLALIVVLAFLIDEVHSSAVAIGLPLLMAATFAASDLLTRGLEGSAEERYDDTPERAEPKTDEQAEPVEPTQEATTRARRSDDLPKYAPATDDDLDAAATESTTELDPPRHR